MDWLTARRAGGAAVVLHGFDEAASKKRRGEFAALPAHEANLQADGRRPGPGAPRPAYPPASAAPGWTASQGTITKLPRNGFRLLAGDSGITDLVRLDDPAVALVFGIGEGLLTEPWWCRTLVLAAERTARRGGTVRLAVAAAQLRRIGPRQAMLDAIDLSLMHGARGLRVGT